MNVKIEQVKNGWIVHRKPGVDEMGREQLPMVFNKFEDMMEYLKRLSGLGDVKSIA